VSSFLTHCPEEAKIALESCILDQVFHLLIQREIYFFILKFFLCFSFRKLNSKAAKDLLAKMVEIAFKKHLESIYQRQNKKLHESFMYFAVTSLAALKETLTKH
jgi:hypothetical protein